MLDGTVADYLQFSILNTWIIQYFEKTNARFHTIVYYSL